MQKIPTLYLRDSQDLRRVTSVLNPVADWVIHDYFDVAASRMFNGVCVMIDDLGRWWARCSVRQDRPVPRGFVRVQRDEVTGTQVGWEPLAQSPFRDLCVEAYENRTEGRGCERLTCAPGTYELCGPQINGNPEKLPAHQLHRHGEWRLFDVPTDFEGLRYWLLVHSQFEGVIWQHTDGRMAKIKRRDLLLSCDRDSIRDRAVS